MRTSNNLQEHDRTQYARTVTAAVRLELERLSVGKPSELTVVAEGARVSREIDPPSPNCRARGGSSTGQGRSGTGRDFQTAERHENGVGHPLIVRPPSNWCKRVQNLRVLSTRLTLRTCPLLHCAICTHPLHILHFALFYHSAHSCGVGTPVSTLARFTRLSH